jgi:hypothetical protein
MGHFSTGAPKLSRHKVMGSGWGGMNSLRQLQAAASIPVRLSGFILRRQVLSIVIALAGVSGLPPCITTTTYCQNTKKDKYTLLLLGIIIVLK